MTKILRIGKYSEPPVDHNAPCAVTGPNGEKCPEPAIAQIDYANHELIKPHFPYCPYHLGMAIGLTAATGVPWTNKFGDVVKQIG